MEEIFKKDIIKTTKFLNQDFIVVRVRETNLRKEDLPLLPLNSDNLLQIRHKYNSKHSEVEKDVRIIINWLMKRRDG